VLLILLVLFIIFVVIPKITKPSYGLDYKDERCYESVGATGICDAYFEGYEYNFDNNDCVKRGISGCSGNTPFISLEECEGVYVE